MQNQNEKSIFEGSKKYLEKSFLEELNYKIWSTKGARFEADKRLRIKAKWSNISLSFLSAYLIIAGLISVYNIHSNIKIQIINYIVTALSIILLVLSQYENYQNYSLRAKEFHKCGLELSTLYNKLRIFKTLNFNCTEEERNRFAVKLSKKYQNILKSYDNHSAIDYENFKNNHKEYFKEDVLSIFYLLLKNLVERYLFYLVIIISPVIFYFFYLMF